MRRKLCFLQYILKQDKKSTIYQVLKVTKENPTKNDFIQTCEKYMKKLDIDMTFEEISEISKGRFNQIVKEKMKIASLNYLNLEKTKQTKICDLIYSKLEMQKYLVDGDRNKNISNLIFKARGKSLDIKLHKKWKFDDKLCSGCSKNEESADEILTCKSFGENTENVRYSWFFSEQVSDQLLVAKIMAKKLKIRKQIREEIT